MFLNALRVKIRNEEAVMRSKAVILASAVLPAGSRMVARSSTKGSSAAPRAR